MSSFETAVADSKKLTAKPSNDELLELYALYKISTNDKPAKPGMFDLKGKAKFAAWDQMANTDGVTEEQAKEKYIALVESLKEKYGYDADKVPETVG